MASSCEVTMSILEVRGQFWGMYDFLKSRWMRMRSEVGILCCRSKCNRRSHMPQNWPLTLYRLIMTSQHDVTPKFMSNLIWFLLTWRNCFFAWLTKIAAGMVLTVTHQWFCNWVRTSYQFILWKEKIYQMLHTFKFIVIFQRFTFLYTPCIHKHLIIDM